LGLIVAGSTVTEAATLTAVWGFLFGAIPVGWSTWVTQELPDDAENAGGLQVAVIQLANTAGAAIGGYVFDRDGATAPLVTSGLLMTVTAILVVLSVRSVPLPDGRNRN
jgi:DHA1 family purine ribonucleoside efflux pump-like MFS transporter